MILRTDLITASRIDLALMLIPDIGWLDVACLLAANCVPLDVAARVLALPKERRRYLASAEAITAPSWDY